ncbi:MAG: extracellular solute-binding protein [Anaerolineaceae bacterium]|nr:extracellular solute-binding protein [Anaerolineaceae bacterium]
MVRLVLASTLILSGCQFSFNNQNAAASPTALQGKSTPKPGAMSSTAPAASPSAAPSKITVSPDSLKGVQINFWHPWTGDIGKQAAALVDEFNQSNLWGIKVNIVEQGSAGGLADALDSSLAAVRSTPMVPTASGSSSVPGNPLPDLVAAPIDELAGWQASNQAIVNLDGYIQDGQWGLSAADLADFPTVYWNADRLGDQQLGIPAERSAQVLFYNQTWAQSLGFNSAPVTPDDFKAQACAAAQANMKDTPWQNNGTGGWVLDTSALTLISWMQSFGGTLPQVENQPYQFDSSQVTDSITYLRQMYDKGCAWAGKEDLPYDYFSSRQALFFSGPLQDILPLTDTLAQQKSTDQWVILPFPSITRKPVLVVDGPSYAVLKSSPERQLAAWLFIHWMIQADHLASMVQASGSLPVRVSEIDALSAFKQRYPQWALAQQWIPVAQPAPRLSTWRQVKPILEDAGSQTFRTNFTADQIPQILLMLDQTIQEVLQKNP